MDRIIKILKLIPEDGFITYRNLSDKLQLSKRTIYSEINDLNEILFDHGAGIISKPRYGLKVEIRDEDLYRTFLKSFEEELPDYGNSESRALLIAKDMLSAEEGFRMDDLCQDYYISRSTLNTDLKKIRTLFARHDLQIVSTAHKGSDVKGTENNKRRCLSEISKRLQNNSDPKMNREMNDIALILRDVFNERKFRIPEYLFNNLVIHFYIAIVRIRHGFSLEEAEGFEQFSDEEERLIAMTIIEKIEKKFGIVFPDTELGYIILNLESRQLKEDNSVIPVEIYETVMEMLDEIDQMFHYDFKYDLELVSLLASHLVSLEVRLLYDIPLDNPLLEEIRQGSLLAFEMAKVACSKLVERYHKKVTADEMAYIALHFHLAIERKKDKRKKNVLIVCGTGRASAELLAYNIRKNYGNTLNVVGTHESTDFTGLNFDDYDYILTTIHIEEKIPIPIIEVNLMHMKESEEKLNEYLSFNTRSDMLQYFKEGLFIGHMKEKTKEEVLSRLCSLAQNEGLAAEGFLEKVLKREKLGTTSFGNSIAIPHPYRPEGEESFVVTGILDEPVRWDDAEAQIIFLLSMKAKGDHSLQPFYRSVGKLLASRSGVARLIEAQDFKTLISVLDSLNEE